MRHEHTQQHVGAIARRDDDATVDEAVQHVGQRHGAHQHIQGFPSEHRRVAAEQLAVARLEQVTDGRCGEQRLVGDRVCGNRSGEGRAHGLDGNRIDPIGDDGEQPSVLSGEFGRSKVGGGADLARPAALAGHHEQHRSAQVDRDPGVVRELSGAADVGVVAADHDHRRAVAGSLVVAVDDRRHRALGVGVHVVVRHAGTHVVWQVDAVVVEQQLEDIIGPVAGAHDRAEHADVADPAGQQVEYAERDRSLPGLALGRRDVHAADHDGEANPEPSASPPVIPPAAPAAAAAPHRRIW